MKKKKFIKKWWFILIIIIVIVGCIGFLGGNSEKDKLKTKEEATLKDKEEKKHIKSKKQTTELKKEKQDKLEKEEQDRIVQEEQTFEDHEPEEQEPIVEEPIDPRITDPNSQYYQSTPEEIEQSKLMEQQAQDDFWANQEMNNEEINTDETTLSGFINKYGMSPAMYKIQNEGMSEEDALRSTPNSMKTSGEIQLGHSKYGI